MEIMLIMVTCPQGKLTTGFTVKLISHTSTKMYSLS